MDRTKFRHFYQLPVRWGDLDALQHVNNVQFARYLECGRVAYCYDVLGIDFSRPPTAGWILADLQCTFHSQLHFPCTIDVATRISSLGNRSAHLEAAVLPEREQKPVLSSKGVFVWFDYKKQKSATVPASVRAQIEAFENI